MDYQRQAKIFRSLGNPVRIQILALLAHGPLCVCDMIQHTLHRQAYISQPLMVLRSIGWVEAQKEGWNVYYQMVDTPETRWLKHMIEEMDVRFEIEQTCGFSHPSE